MAARFALSLFPVFSLICALMVAGSVVTGRLDQRGAVLIYEAGLGASNVDIFAYDLLRSRAYNLTRHPTADQDATWSPDGAQLAFISRRAGERNLYVQPLGGTARQVAAERIVLGYRPVWSPDGRRIVYEVSGGSSVNLYLVDLAEGNASRPLTNSSVTNRFSTWSPDGALIAFVSWDAGDAEIMTVNPDTDEIVNLTSNPAWDVSPSWSPDGSQIAFFSTRSGYRELYLMDRDGRNVQRITSQELPLNTALPTPAVWSPDGTRLAFTVMYNRNGDTIYDLNSEIMVVDRDGRQLMRLTNTTSRELRPLWTPDGEHIIFSSDRGGRWNLYQMRADGSEQRMIDIGEHDKFNPSWWSSSR